ncbi:hypothetical protein WJX72_006331 [[Myrmecia] bisecta]|uniref:GOLD domain-containing protein n=1 Tax=[Myrmecia] bisecta TaxID=41462 RepID=A0AAW1QFC4_9CHLO
MVQAGDDQRHRKCHRGVGSFVSLEAEGYKPLVRLRVTNSNGEEVYSVGAKAEDKFSIRARTPGQYSFCLTLAPSSATRLGKRGYRDVLWHLQKGHLFTHHQVTENHLNPLLEIVSGLKGDLMECRSLQLYLKDRELRHRHTVDSTHSRVKGYAALQMLTVIVASVLQVAFIRKLFSTEGVRRVHSKTDI